MADMIESIDSMHEFERLEHMINRDCCENDGRLSKAERKWLSRRLSEEFKVRDGNSARVKLFRDSDEQNRGASNGRGKKKQNLESSLKLSQLFVSHSQIVDENQYIQSTKNIKPLDLFNLYDKPNYQENTPQKSSNVKLTSLPIRQTLSTPTSPKTRSKVTTIKKSHKHRSSYHTLASIEWPITIKYDAKDMMKCRPAQAQGRNAGGRKVRKFGSPRPDIQKCTVGGSIATGKRRSVKKSAIVNYSMHNGTTRSIADNIRHNDIHHCDRLVMNEDGMRKFNEDGSVQTVKMKDGVKLEGEDLECREQIDVEEIREAIESYYDNQVKKVILLYLD